MEKTIIFNIPPWPEYSTGSYRSFEQDEKHITRICSEFVLLFMLERTLYFTEDGQEVSVEPGQWYMQIPGLKQEGRKGSPAPVYYYIHFDGQWRMGDGGKTILENRGDTNKNSENFTLPIRGSFDIKYFKPLFDQLDSLSRRHTPELMAKQAIFLNIINSIKTTAGTSSNGVKEITIQLMDFIARNYNKNINIDDLSSEFHFSSDYLTRKMREYAGITPGQYIQQIRIEKSKELLSNTDYTLAFIASNIGYNDLSVFYKAFKKQTGMAPGLWRLKNRGLNCIK